MTFNVKFILKKTLTGKKSVSKKLILNFYSKANKQKAGKMTKYFF